MDMTQHEALDALNTVSLELGARGFARTQPCVFTRYDRVGPTLTLNVFEAVRGAGPVVCVNHTTDEEYTIPSIPALLEGL